MPAVVCEGYVWKGQERVWLTLLWSYPDLEMLCTIKDLTKTQFGVLFLSFLFCQIKLIRIFFKNYVLNDMTCNFDSRLKIQRPVLHKYNFSWH